MRAVALRYSPSGARASERKKTGKQNEGWEEDKHKVPTCTSRILEGRSGTHRGTGVGSASRHGGGLGRVHPHDRVPGIPLSYRTRLHPAAPGAGAGLLLVALS